MLFSTFSLYITLQYVKSGRRCFLPFLFVSNLLFSGLHFLTLLVLGAQCAVVLVWFISTRPPRWFGKIVVFSVCSLTPYVLSVAFLRNKLSSISGGTRFDVAELYFKTLLRVIAPESTVPYLIIALLIFVLSFFQYRRSRNVYLPLLALYAVIPLAPLVIVKYNSYFNPWHLSFALPALLVILSEGIRFGIERSKWLSYAGMVAYSLAVAGIVWSGHFFSIDSHTGQYKQLSQQMKSLDLSTSTLLPTDFGTLAGIAWYSRHAYGLTPWDASARVHHVRNARLAFLSFGDFAHYAKNAQDFKEKYGRNATVQSFSGATLYTLPVEYDALTIHSLPYALELTAEPLSFFSRIQNYKNISIIPFFGFKAIPFLSEEPAYFEYEFSLDGAADQRLYKIVLKFIQSSPDDQIIFSYHFDDDPYVDFERTNTVCNSEQTTTLLLKSSASHRKLYLRCAMDRKSAVPGYIGYDNTVLSFDAMRIYANSLEQERFVSSTLDIASEGLGTPEHDHAESYAWAYGPKTTLTFTSPEDTSVTIDYAFNNPIPNQDVALYCNGKEVRVHRNLPAQPWLRDATSGTLVVPAVKGANTIEFVYRAWNHCPQDASASFAPNDGRPMALAFTKLLLNTPLAAKSDFALRF